MLPDFRIIETVKQVRRASSSRKLKVKARSPGLRQFLATENSFKMMRNALYFTLKVLFVRKTFKFLLSLFGHAGERLDKYAKIYDVIN